MISYNKPRLHSVENIMRTRAMRGQVSDEQIDAVHEEALEVVRAALDGEHGVSDFDIPFLCAALHFWRDELIKKMRRDNPGDLKAEASAYILMKRHYQIEVAPVGGGK